MNVFNAAQIAAVIILRFQLKASLAKKSQKPDIAMQKAKTKMKFKIGAMEIVAVYSNVMVS